MKRYLIIVMLLVLAGWATLSEAKQYVYKWVKDKQASSQTVLSASQASRVAVLKEDQALEVIRKVMTDDLYLALAEYHKTWHQQDAETTPDSVLPEAVISQTEVELIDEDYCFLLEIKLKDYAHRTRITARAYPLYRIHDVEAEEALNSETAESTVEIKVKGGEHAAIGVGRIFVEPMEGIPSDYTIQPLPDAAERAAKLVKSFIYLLDKRIAAVKK